ncbi:MAG: cytochrome b N-terminal domain-containing protein [Cyanobacteria bacterium CAN_BIN43]|jgi:cytochrome b6|nr:cytochrome b N-terminal domain-containing protein [Cyanobacteria bacterium CAN_BIN43]
MKTLDYRFALQRTTTILAVVALSLVLLAGITGVALAFYYEPTAGGAHRSLEFITRDVSSGAIIRSLHDIAGNALIVVALLQLVVMFVGRQFRPSWLAAWVSGILLALVAIGASWTAIILDWDQVGFWRFKLEMKTIESIPVVGATLREIITGGGVNSLTVQHMYTLHSYLLSVIAITLSVLHLVALVYQERDRQQFGKKLDQLVSDS